MDKKQKIVNADDQELINPDAVHSYDAGTEENDPAKNEYEPLKEDKPFPDEIADPEEQEDEDEMA